MDDRRAAPRHPINGEFQSIEQFISEYAQDISAAGCFIRSRQPLPVGTLVALHFTVLEPNLAIIEGEGEVTRTTPEGMGVRFTALSEASRAHLAEIAAHGRPHR